jgi:hypothetical protein
MTCGRLGRTPPNSARSSIPRTRRRRATRSAAGPRCSASSARRIIRGRRRGRTRVAQLRHAVPTPRLRYGLCAARIQAPGSYRYGAPAAGASRYPRSPAPPRHPPRVRRAGLRARRRSYPRPRLRHCRLAWSRPVTPMAGAGGPIRQLRSRSNAGGWHRGAVLRRGGRHPRGKATPWPALVGVRSRRHPAPVAGAARPAVSPLSSPERHPRVRPVRQWHPARSGAVPPSSGVPRGNAGRRQSVTRDSVARRQAWVPAWSAAHHSAATRPGARGAGHLAALPGTTWPAANVRPYPEPVRRNPSPPRPDHRRAQPGAAAPSRHRPLRRPHRAARSRLADPSRRRTPVRYLPPARRARPAVSARRWTRDARLAVARCSRETRAARPAVRAHQWTRAARPAVARPCLAPPARPRRAPRRRPPVRPCGAPPDDLPDPPYRPTRSAGPPMAWRAVPRRHHSPAPVGW